MDRNGNFDYRNFFYPGPAPLPVQIYPVSGDPRFPFHFPPAGAATNINVSGGGRGDPTSPSAREDITAADDADQSPLPPAGSNNSAVAKRDAAAAASSATTTTPPVKLDHVVQGLSHLLAEAITFCEECLKTHKDVTAAAPFAGHATRNRLWRELLEARFEASGVHKDLLHTLVPRVRRYTAQAQQAVTSRAGASDGDDGDGDGDEHYRLTLMADKLLAQCNWVAQINRKALGSSAACESMVETMREMMVLCGKIGGGECDGQEGGGGGY